MLSFRRKDNSITREAAEEEAQWASVPPELAE